MPGPKSLILKSCISNFFKLRFQPTVIREKEQVINVLFCYKEHRLVIQHLVQEGVHLPSFQANLSQHLIQFAIPYTATISCARQIFPFRTANPSGCETPFAMGPFHSSISTSGFRNDAIFSRLTPYGMLGWCSPDCAAVVSFIRFIGTPFDVWLLLLVG